MKEKRALYRLYYFMVKKCPESQKSDSGTNGAGGVALVASNPVLERYNDLGFRGNIKKEVPERGLQKYLFRYFYF